MGTMTLASKVEVEYCLSYNMTRKDRDETKST